MSLSQYNTASQRGRRKRRKSPGVMAAPKEKRTYGKSSIVSAVNEAETLLSLTNAKRLSLCQYKFYPREGQVQDQQPNRESGSKKVRFAPNAKARDESSSGYHSQTLSQNRKMSQKSVQKRSVVQNSGKLHEKVLENWPGCEEDKENVPKTRGRPPFKARVEAERNQRLEKLREHRVKSVQHASVQTEKSVMNSPGEPRFMLRHLEGEPLGDRSKEEKLTLDIEMYRRNQRAFEHDLTRFQLRNGCKTFTRPRWQGAQVSVFLLFQAVVERGGFYQVSRGALWREVYREVTDTDVSKNSASSVGNTTVVRDYYERYLLAYELYLSGRDYSFLVGSSSSRLPMFKQPWKHWPHSDVTTAHDVTQADVTDTATPRHCDVIVARSRDSVKGDSVTSNVTEVSKNAQKSQENPKNLAETQSVEKSENQKKKTKSKEKNLWQPPSKKAMKTKSQNPAKNNQSSQKVPNFDSQVSGTVEKGWITVDGQTVTERMSVTVNPRITDNGRVARVADNGKVVDSEKIVESVREEVRRSEADQMLAEFDELQSELMFPEDDSLQLCYMDEDVKSVHSKHSRHREEDITASEFACSQVSLAEQLVPDSQGTDSLDAADHQLMLQELRNLEQQADMFDDLMSL